jgi:hypothetical protein
MPSTPDLDAQIVAAERDHVTTTTDAERNAAAQQLDRLNAAKLLNTAVERDAQANATSLFVRRGDTSADAS